MKKDVKKSNEAIFDLFKELEIHNVYETNFLNFDLNNEVYNPYSNTSKTMFSTSSEAK